MSVPFLYDGVTTNVIAPQPTVPVGSPNLPSVLIGTGSWGQPNVGIPFTATADLYDGVGSIQQVPSDLATHCTQYILACAAMGTRGNGYAIRVTDGTDAAATVTVLDTTTPTAGFVLLLTAKCTGVRGNSGTATVTPNAQWTTSKPIYDISLTISGAVSEVFQGIVANNGTAYNAATFVANARNAINSGLNLSRGPSKYWIASAPGTQSTVVPLLSTSFASSGTGTNGSGSLASSNYVGTPGLSATGMYAAGNLECGQFILCGCVDQTIAATMAAFATSNNCIAVGPSFPENTATATAITSKQTNNFNAISSVAILDFVQWYDPTLGQLRSLSPESNVLGVIGATSPEQNPGNNPQIGLPHLVSTDRTASGSYNPRTGTEASQATQAGITWIGPMNRNKSFLGLANGQNASGLAGQDGINYPRLTNYLKTALPLIVGSFVDALQGVSNTDPTRRGVRNALNNFFKALQTNGQIDNFNVVCDTSNNTQTTIAAGQLNVAISVEYLGAARFITLNLQGGVNVTITSNVASIPQAA
jgi:hypothetical protein